MQPERSRTTNLFARRTAALFWTYRRLPLRASQGVEEAGGVRGRKRGGLSLLLGSVLLLTVAAGCGPRSVPPPQKPFQAVTLTVACPGEPAATVVRRYSQIWASRTGARIVVVPYDPATEPESGPPADLWVVSPARMPHWANAGKLWPVPETLTQGTTGYAWQNLLPLYRYKLCFWEQKVYALPLLGDVPICFYREDLFQDGGHRVAFRKRYGRELVHPATWEHFAQLAEYFHNQPRPGIDRPCPSLPPLPEHLDDLDPVFYSVAAPFAHRAIREDDPSPPSAVEVFSFHYDLESGAVRIDTPGFVRALRLLQRLQAFRPPRATPDPPSAFEKGEAVLCLASPAWIGRFQESSPVRDKFGICRVPGSEQVADYATGQERLVPGGNWVPYLGAGGWMMVVPRRNAEPEAAFSLAASLSDPKISQDIVIEPAWGGGVFRREHLESGIGWHQLGLDRQRAENLVNTLRETILHPQVKNPVLRLRTPDERAHQQALDTELRAALLDGKDASQALHAAAQRWRQLDESKEKKTRLAEYRLSLSLGR
jgi:ABC-type glycerol-3-phosphate transport system substrate-binding protein